jgi:hypothetical protein
MIFVQRSSSRDPIQTSWATQIKPNTLTARTAKPTVAMISPPVECTPTPTPLNFNVKSAVLGPERDFSFADRG